jgi:hypothetical protein
MTRNGKDSPAGPFGPWSPTCDRIERGKQLRTLAAIAYMRLGPHHPLVAELRATEHDAMDSSGPKSSSTPCRPCRGVASSRPSSQSRGPPRKPRSRLQLGREGKQ